MADGMWNCPTKGEQARLPTATSRLLRHGCLHYRRLSSESLLYHVCQPYLNCLLYQTRLALEKSWCAPCYNLVRLSTQLVLPNGAHESWPLSSQMPLHISNTARHMCNGEPGLGITSSLGLSSRRPELTLICIPDVQALEFCGHSDSRGLGAKGQGSRLHHSHLVVHMASIMQEHSMHSRHRDGPSSDTASASVLDASWVLALLVAGASLIQGAVMSSQGGTRQQAALQCWLLQWLTHLHALPISDAPVEPLCELLQVYQVRHGHQGLHATMGRAEEEGKRKGDAWISFPQTACSLSGRKDRGMRTRAWARAGACSGQYPWELLHEVDGGLKLRHLCASEGLRDGNVLENGCPEALHAHPITGAPHNNWHQAERSRFRSRHGHLAPGPDPNPDIDRQAEKQKTCSNDWHGVCDSNGTSLSRASPATPVQGMAEAALLGWGSSSQASP